MTGAGISRTRLPDPMPERLAALEELLPSNTRTRLSGTHPLSFLLFDRGVDLWVARWEDHPFLLLEAGGYAYLPAPPPWTIPAQRPVPTGTLERPDFWKDCAVYLASWNGGRPGRLEGLPMGVSVPAGSEPRRTETDYLLERGGWTSFEGHDFKTLRWERNRLFRLRPDLQARHWDDAFRPETKSLLDRFFADRREHTQDPYALALLDDQREAHEKALAQAPALGLEGWILVSARRLIGIEWYASGSQDAICFLEARDPELTGVPAQLTRSYFEAHADCVWINIQGSSGVPSLEQAKSLERPALAVPSYAQELLPES